MSAPRNNEASTNQPQPGSKSQVSKGTGSTDPSIPVTSGTDKDTNAESSTPKNDPQESVQASGDTDEEEGPQESDTALEGRLEEEKAEREEKNRRAKQGRGGGSKDETQ